MGDLKSTDQSILNKGFLEFQPFGKTPTGDKICDVSGVTVRANVEYLEEVVARRGGQEAGREAVDELVRLLNERIADPAYRVTVEFLKNHWNSYSYEFVMFLSEFCAGLSRDPHFHFNLGREKFLSPIIQILGRPFSIQQIYRLYPYFVEKYTKGALLPEVVSVSDRCAIMRLQLSEHTKRQFGPYWRACAERICQSTKATIAAVPAKMFHRKPAGIEDRACMGKGDPSCEWAFTWEPHVSPRMISPLGGLGASALTWAGLRLWLPEMPVVESTAFAVVTGLLVWLISARQGLRKEGQERERVIEEQIRSVEARHEELREAYLEQEQTSAELRRRVSQLTTLHQTGLLISSTLEWEKLVTTALEAISRDLGYDQTLLALTDEDHRVLRNARLFGETSDLAEWVRSAELPIDADMVESRVLAEGVPVLVGDVQEKPVRVHPLVERVAAVTGARAWLFVPLILKHRVLGILVVSRAPEYSLGKDDQDLLMTVSRHLAIALDHAEAYRRIEELNVGLETKVRERTQELERLNRDLAAANDRLREMDRLKSQFLSHVSHELRTPLASIKGFLENILRGLAGPLAEKQAQCLTRVQKNADRLGRMIADLLDLSRIEAGKLEVVLAQVDLPRLVEEVVEQMQPLARAKTQFLGVQVDRGDLSVRGDADRISQILMNLLENAIKFTPEGGRVDVRVRRPDAWTAEISVSDAGMGIPREAVDKLFDPFFQAHREQGIGTKGLGLGLAIVKHLVDLHHGRITVESQPGKGTTMQVRLPVQQPAELHETN